MFQPDSLTDVPFEENFKLQFNHHDGLPSNRVGHSGGENLVLCSAGSSIHHHSQCTNDDRSSQLVTPSYNPRTYLKSGDLPSSHHSTVVRNENRTSGNLGSSFDHQTQKSSTASKFCPSQHMYDRSILMQSQNSSSEENGSLNMSIEPSSMTPYRPSVSSTIHNEKGGQNSHTESQNLPVAPHSMHGPYTSVDEQQQHQTEIKSPSRHVHLKEECKPQPVQQQVCHTNIETTSQQSHHHKTCHDIEGNPSSPSVHKPSTTMVHQIRGNFQHNVSPPVVTRRPHPQPTSIQYHDSGPDVQKGRKVFILHYVPDNDVHLSQVILSLAVCLRNMKVDVSIDMFERDKTVDNWSIWYEKEILSSGVVLCIITPNFYSSLTDSDRVRGYSVYNLLNNSKGIAFRAVFLDRQKNMEDVPLSMRGATCYSISSEHLTVNDEEFASLYAFLTGQNRVEKPPLGNMVVLSPRRSKCKLSCDLNKFAKSAWYNFRGVTFSSGLYTTLNVLLGKAQRRTCA